MNQIFLFAKKNKKLIILISVLVLIFGVLIFHLNTNKESFFNPTPTDGPRYRPIYEKLPDTTADPVYATPSPVSEEPIYGVINADRTGPQFADSGGEPVYSSLDEIQPTTAPGSETRELTMGIRNSDGEERGIVFRGHGPQNLGLRPPPIGGGTAPILSLGMAAGSSETAHPAQVHALALTHGRIGEESSGVGTGFVPRGGSGLARGEVIYRSTSEFDAVVRNLEQVVGSTADPIYARVMPRSGGGAAAPSIRRIPPDRLPSPDLPPRNYDLMCVLDGAFAGAPASPPQHTQTAPQDLAEITSSHWVSDEMEQPINLRVFEELLFPRRASSSLLEFYNHLNGRILYYFLDYLILPETSEDTRIANRLLRDAEFRESIQQSTSNNFSELLNIFRLNLGIASRRNFGLQLLDGPVDVREIRRNLSVGNLPRENATNIRFFRDNLAGLFYRALTTDRGDGSGVLQFIEGDDGELLLRITYGTRQYYNSSQTIGQTSQLLQNPNQIYPTEMSEDFRLMDQSNLVGHSATGSQNTLGAADWIDPVRDANYRSVTVPWIYFTTHFSRIRELPPSAQTQLDHIIICLIGAFLFMLQEPQTSTTRPPTVPDDPPPSGEPKPTEPPDSKKKRRRGGGRRFLNFFRGKGRKGGEGGEGEETKTIPPCGFSGDDQHDSEIVNLSPDRFKLQFYLLYDAKSEKLLHPVYYKLILNSLLNLKSTPPNPAAQILMASIIFVLSNLETVKSLRIDDKQEIGKQINFPNLLKNVRNGELPKSQMQLYLATVDFYPTTFNGKTLKNTVLKYQIGRKLITKDGYYYHPHFKPIRAWYGIVGDNDNEKTLLVPHNLIPYANLEKQDPQSSTEETNSNLVSRYNQLCETSQEYAKGAAFALFGPMSQSLVGQPASQISGKLEGFTNYSPYKEDFKTQEEINCACGPAGGAIQTGCSKCCNYLDNFNSGTMDCTTEENKFKPLCKTVDYYKRNYGCEP